MDKELFDFVAERADGLDVVHEAGGGLGVDHHHVRDGRVGVESGRDLLDLQNLVVGLRIDRMRNARVAADLDHALAIGAVRAHEDLLVVAHDAREHGLVAKGPGALHQHGRVGRGVAVAQAHQLGANLLRDGLVVVIPRAVVEEHLLLHRHRGGERSGGEQLVGVHGFLPWDRPARRTCGPSSPRNVACILREVLLAIWRSASDTAQNACSAVSAHGLLSGGALGGLRDLLVVLEQLDGQRLGELALVCRRVVGRDLALVERLGIGLHELGAPSVDDGRRHLLRERVRGAALVDHRHGLRERVGALGRVHDLDGQALRLVRERLVAQAEADGDLTRSHVLDRRGAGLREIRARVAIDSGKDLLRLGLAVVVNERLDEEPRRGGAGDVGQRDHALVDGVGKILEARGDGQPLARQHLGVVEDRALLRLRRRAVRRGPLVKRRGLEVREIGEHVILGVRAVHVVGGHRDDVSLEVRPLGEELPAEL